MKIQITNGSTTSDQSATGIFVELHHLQILSSLSFKTIMLLFFLMVSSITIAQDIVFPPADISCTSKDLELVGAALPPPDEDPCNCSGTRLLELSIYNKTGSTRTSFAFWGYLHRYDSDGVEIGEPEPIFACVGPVPPNSTTTLVSSTEIEVTCDTSLEITDLYLAWTSASPNATCESLANDPGGINPKCGTLDAIKVETGVNGILSVVDADCTTGGSIQVSPFGGIPPYSVQLNGGTGVQLQVGGSTTYSALAASTYTVLITDSRGCTNTFMRTINPVIPPVAEAGSPFKITCVQNVSGGTIGESGETGYTYSWQSSPEDLIFDSTIANPVVVPLVTTTYTVTKTNTSNGCTDTDTVIITVDNAVVTANAGADFTKTCVSNPDGAQIGEDTTTGFSYSWSPATGLSVANISNPTANPTTTTTYTVTKTNTATGCFDTDTVEVTVNNADVVAEAGNSFTKTCTSNDNGAQIGEAGEAGFTYSWLPITGLSASDISNPTANPTSTTIYTVTKTNSTTGCFDTDTVTVTVDNAIVTANAGSDFTITCEDNVGGSGIGEASVTGFTYSWSPTTGLSASNISNPTANPTSTTTYTVTKTNDATGCLDTDTVEVTVNNATVTAEAGNSFIKTCISNASGAVIGEASETGFTYSWSPATGLSASNIGNPTANPISTTIYTVTKTNSTTGCFDRDTVTVTVDTDTPSAPTICVVEPSLCGPDAGSISFLSPLVGDYEYSIDGGANYQDSPDFIDLEAGSVSGILVRDKSSGCVSSSVSCSDSDCPSAEARMASTTVPEDTSIKQLPSKTIIKAYPNPFNDQVNFKVVASEDSKGSLELMNLLGQRVKMVFEGDLKQGENSYNVNLPALQNNTLIYVLTVNGERVTGKLVQSRR
ncbi:T9SS type A sorting domain-containing protein [Mangrovimonas sp. DI 80]|uniref:T9SS type A sorting domain-containing protein n=1 Tax=Mangrovimonas sp. DI 80 TaxID=1779330 RepID=UPI0009FAD833|nr:T9SS type A sorting domain-containing protein [Mangrovimonas sp. DI 80]